MLYKTIDNSCQMLFELFNEEMFGAFPDHLIKIMAQGPATMVIRESMRKATKTILNQTLNFRNGLLKLKHCRLKGTIIADLRLN